MIRRRLPVDSKLFLLTMEADLVSGMLVQEVSVRAQLSTEGIEWIRGVYHPFGFRAIATWANRIIQLLVSIHINKIGVIHCWGTPAGAIGSVLSVLTRRPLIIDSYEPHAESMVENGTWKRNSFAFKILFWFEKVQTRRAKYLISANAGMKAYAKVKYGCELENMLVKPACVNFDLFQGKNYKSISLLKELKLEGMIVCVYAGKFGGIYLEKETFDFFKTASDYWGEKFRVLLMTRHSPTEVSAYCRGSGLDPDIVQVRFVPHHQIADYLGLASFAITPVKPVPTKRYCTPIKNGEYWAMGLPVVIPANISDDSDIIRNNHIGAVLEELNKQAYHEAVIKIDALLSEPRSVLAQKIRAVAMRYRNFEIAEGVYEAIYGR